MSINLENLSDFLSSIKSDTERMNHIKHYPDLIKLYQYANLALDLALVGKTMIDHKELFDDVGEANIDHLKNLLNRS